MKTKLFIVLFGFILFGFSVFSWQSCQRNKHSQTTVGVILPLTGDYAPYGLSCQKGMETALKEFLEENKDFPVKANFQDNKSTTKDAVNAIRQLISVHKSPVIIGGMASNIALAIAPVAEQSKTVLLIPFASSPKLTEAGKYIFRIMPSDAFQAALLPKWIAEENKHKVGLIYANNDWGVSLKNEFIKNASANNIEIVFQESINEGDKDFRPVVNKLLNTAKTTQMDAVFMPVYPQEAGVILRQYTEVNKEKKAMQFYGADSWANDLLLKTAGATAEGVKFLAPKQYDGPESSAFTQLFKQLYQIDPDLPAAAGYDAMKLVLEAVKSEYEKSKVVKSDGIQAILNETVGFKGATGTTAFDQNGDVVSKEFVRYTVSNGKLITTE
jgi:branched-chain amino acid transport system substrate-binding protein